MNSTEMNQPLLPPSTPKNSEPKSKPEPETVPVPEISEIPAETSSDSENSDVYQHFLSAHNSGAFLTSSNPGTFIVSESGSSQSSRITAAQIADFEKFRLDGNKKKALYHYYALKKKAVPWRCQYLLLFGDFGLSKEQFGDLLQLCHPDLTGVPPTTHLTTLSRSSGVFDEGGRRVDTVDSALEFYFERQNWFLCRTSVNFLGSAGVIAGLGSGAFLIRQFYLWLTQTN